MMTAISQKAFWLYLTVLLPMLLLAVSIIFEVGKLFTIIILVTWIGFSMFIAQFFVD